MIKGVKTRYLDNQNCQENLNLFIIAYLWQDMMKIYVVVMVSIIHQSYMVAKLLLPKVLR